MAAGKIANLSVGVALDAAQFTSGLGRAEADAVRFGGALRARGTQIGATFAASVTGPLAAAFAAFNLAAFAKSTIDALDAFNDLSDATGASVENISALEEAARRTGGTFETVESVLLKFNKQLGEAGDNDAGDAFRALGLDLARLKQIDAAEALQQTAAALLNVEDANVRARITTELFGKGVKEAAPFLKDLAEQGRLNATVTSQQAAAAEAFNKGLAVLQTEVVNAARSLVSEMLPALSALVGQLNDGRAAYGSFTSALLDLYRVNPFKNVTENISTTREAMGELQDKIRELQEEAAQQSEAEKRWSPTEGRLGKLNEELRLLKARETYLLKQQERDLPQAAYGHEGGLRTGTSADRPTGEDPLAVAKARREAEEALRKAAEDARKKAADVARQRAEDVGRYLDGLQRQIEGEQKLTAVEQLDADMAAKRFVARNQQDEQQARALAARLDAIRAEEEATKAAAESAKRLQEAQQQVKAEGAAIFEATRTPLEQYQAKMERLRELFEGGHLGPDADRTYDRAAKAYDEELKEADDAFKQLTEFSKQASRNIQDALGQAIEDSFDGNLRSMAQSWLEMLRKMAAQALAAQLGNQLFGTGIGTKNEGWLGSLISQGAAAFFGSSTPAASPTAYSDPNLFTIPKLATGTNYVPRDGMLASLHRGEAVVPAKYNPARAGREMKVNIQNHGQDVQTRRNGRGELDIIVRGMMRDAFAQDMASGGPMSRAQQRTFGLTRALERR